MTSFRKSHKNLVFCMYFSGFLDLFGVSMILPLISTHIRDLGASSTMTGLIGSIYGTLQLFSSPAIGQWSDLSGRRFCLLCCLLISAGGYLLLGFSTNLVILLLSRVPTGMFKHSQSISKSYLAELTEGNARSGVLGNFNAASSIGFIVGPMVGGVLAETEGGFYKVAIVCAVTFIINAVVVYIFIEEAPVLESSDDLIRNDSQISLKKLGSEEVNFSPKQLIESFSSFDWKTLWDLFLIKFLLGFSMLIYRSNYSLTMRDKFQLTPSNLGYLISYHGTTSALCGFLVGWISKWFKNDAQIVFYMAGLQSVTFFLLGFVTSFSLFVICSTPLSLFSAMMRVSATNLTIQRCGGKNVGGILGMSQSVMSLARMFSPFISGIVLEFSASGNIFAGAFISLSAVVLMIYKPQHQDLLKEKIS